MARQGDLFGWKRPRSAPRILAHLTDCGDHGCVYQPGMRMVALFTCPRCEWESRWIEMPSVTACRKGIACEPCNAERAKARNSVGRPHEPSNSAPARQNRIASQSGP
jgi:hypothetical protein